ncbi:protein of unknown function [Modestobacter italicus]|uniref:NERD domain-containing protein n=1 Tax=Modestobacter italicus (strain DSM 44449 / CECT 9708 / BC 501) TaxID=2732864 RepID=I4F1G6_MODI5|nr:nuclease-related domain-containing protein [Modestobacter marinus]CCH89479.1 protein of unknown function [Modestobacter marinus]
MERGDLDRGTPGGSLLREYEQRRTRREREVRSRHPRLGGLILALGDEPATTANFRRGATAEVQVAEQLMRRCGDEVEFLFNRRLSPRGRDGDIDVLAVAPNGVHIVDVKRYRGAAVRIKRRGGLLSRPEQQLLIRGHDQTRLLDSVQRQHQVVRRVLDQLPDGTSVTVHLALCFVDADLPLVDNQLDGIALLGPRGVVRRLLKQGPLSPATRGALVRHLAGHLPAA